MDLIETQRKDYIMWEKEEYLSGPPEIRLEDTTDTPKEERTPLTFNVSMESFITDHFKDELISLASSRMIDSIDTTSKLSLKKEIHDTVIKKTQEKLSSVLEDISFDIVNQPKTTNLFSGSKEEAVTVGEFIGLSGKDFLTQHVDAQGNTTKDTYRYGTKTPTRIEWIVDNLLKQHFKTEIKSAVDGIVKELKDDVNKLKNEFIKTEKTRMKEAVKEALEKAIDDRY